MKNIFYVALGGIFGAIFRFLVSKRLNNAFGEVFPVGTLFVNFTGSFFMGFFYSIFEEVLFSPYVRIFLLTGFLGAYTTFSTYAIETFNFLREKEYKEAFLNFILNNILSFLAVIAGFILFKFIYKEIRKI